MAYKPLGNKHKSIQFYAKVIKANILNALMNIQMCLICRLGTLISPIRDTWGIAHFYGET